MKADHSNLQINVLGPLEVRCDGDELDPGPPKQRALLIRLLMENGQSVRVDRLRDDLWSDSESSGSTSSIYAYINRLRAVMEPKRQRYSESKVLVSEQAGYALRLARTTLDAVRFEHSLAAAHRLLLDGNASASFEEIDQALGLWRGSAYGDVADYHFARHDILQLEDLRLEAIELRISAMLAQKKYGMAAVSAQKLTSRHPLRESAWVLVMRALYLAGRPAEALQQFDTFRRKFIEEIGLEPGAALRELQLTILRRCPLT